MYMGNFCSRLIAAREKAELGQAELAREAAVSRGTIISWENNPHQRHDPDKLKRVARVLGIEPEDIEGSPEAVPITTPARLHSWLNEHLEAVVEAEARRRASAEVARTFDAFYREAPELAQQAIPVLQRILGLSVPVTQDAKSPDGRDPAPPQTSPNPERTISGLHRGGPAVQAGRGKSTSR